jgi:hypothetical protein
VQTDATLLWFRTETEGERLLAVGAERLVVGGDDLSSHLNVDGVVALSRAGPHWTRTPGGA